METQISSGVAGDGTVTSTSLLLPDGTVAAPSAQFASDNDGSGTGVYRVAANQLGVAINGVFNSKWSSGNFQLSSATSLSWSNSSGDAGTNDVVVSRITTNALMFSQSGATTTSRTEINKAITAFTNATLKATFTVTVPNAAHNATLEVRVMGALGAGGAVGAGEAMATNTYVIGIVRTAGVATVATATAAFGAVAVAVAGAATVTATAAVSAMTGLVSATQTFTIDVTISRSGGASDNHTAVVYGKLINANATGITIA